MVLLHVLNSLAAKNHWEIYVAHFNHRLRGRASGADEMLVRQTAKKLRLKFFGSGAEVKAFAASAKISVEMAARKLRHEFLARTAREQKVSVVALAHHADDQVELFFLRLLRGAGGEGLAGMKWRSPSPADKMISLARPLLAFSKAEILAFARQNKICFRDDATNFSNDFLRNRIRNELLPLLQKNYQPGLMKTVLRVMEIIGAEAGFVGDVAQAWLARGGARATGAVKSCVPSGTFERIFPGRGACPAKPAAGVLPGFENLPAAFQRKILQLQLTEAGVASDFELIEQLRVSANRFVSVNTMVSFARDAAGRLRCNDNSARGASGAELKFKLSGRAGRVGFGGGEFGWRSLPQKKFQLPPKRLAGETPTAREFFDADKIGGEIILRHWRPGDRFQPIGLKSAAKLQDLFVNAKIPSPRRRELVLAATADAEIFWVGGLRIGEKFKLTPETKRILVWSVQLK